METILEQQRRLHEERERISAAVVREYLGRRGTLKEQINSDHRIKLLLDRYADASASLRDLYEDKDGSRKSEITSLSGPNEFAEFYTRLKATKDFYRKHPEEVSIPMSVEFEQLTKAADDPSAQDEMMADFTGEEGNGRYLDLHECYRKYLNLRGVEKTDYVTYLTMFDQLYDVPKERKTSEYCKYLESLIDYLVDFLSRVKPLLDINEEIQKALDDFERKWLAETFPGWTPQAGGTSSAMAHSGAYLDLSPYNSPDELVPLGLDRLKGALMALGLKCGGTVEERAQRLFMTKGRRLEDLDPSLLVKKPSVHQVTAEQNKNKEVAKLEAQVYHMVELVSEQRAATKDNVERKQARGGSEEDELEEEAPVQDDAESDDDDIPYNPKNLPLGWDGKPIPYWLYKLHGLNINYPCEICGNQIYKGPKAFQRHFSEWRHSHGMRCLGIPNTAHFANITKIGEAIQLWHKLRVEKEEEAFKPELEEEFEDSMGNVVNRRVFEDLKRQGLL